MAQFSYANATAEHCWVDDARSTTLPFELIDGHIIVPVSVNGSEPLRFVLDSGASATVILESSSTKSLPLNMGAAMTVSGVGTGEDPQAYIIEDTNLTVGSVHLQGLSVVYLPLDSVPFFDNLDEVYFDGVIGAPFFKRLLVEIDYDQQKIVFSEPDTLQTRLDASGDAWQALPLQIISGLPYLTTQISTQHDVITTVKLLVDTGYRGPISLTPESHDEIDEPAKFFVLVSQGISGEVVSHVGLSQFLLMGDSTLHAVPVSYAITGGENDDDSNGLIGSDVLGKFNLIFDYSGEQVFIAPNQHFLVPIIADRSGLLVRIHRLGAVVKSIAAGSSANQIGLQPGDIITHIDDLQVTRANFTPLKAMFASNRQAVSICWLSADNSDQSQCANLQLNSRFSQQGL
jgi:predicted aspartyl protease